LPETDPTQGHVALQFVVHGFVSVALNTLADIMVVFAASGIRESAAARPRYPPPARGVGSRDDHAGHRLRTGEAPAN
jgi:hypothetical protein